MTLHGQKELQKWGIGGNGIDNDKDTRGDGRGN